MAMRLERALWDTGMGSWRAKKMSLPTVRRNVAVLMVGGLLSACSMHHSSTTASLQSKIAAPVAAKHKSAAPAVTKIRVTNLRIAQPVEAGWTKGKPGSSEGKAAEDGAGDSEGFMDANDPLEPANRVIFAVNDAVDTIVLKPVAVTYDFWTPEPLKNSVRNVLRNLATPVTLLNDILQGNLDRARTTVGRFVLNSTIGFAGLGDPATEMGLRYHYEDFGQTMAVHGVGEGFYLVLPVLGPSSLRHTVGRAVDFATDPLTWYLWKRPIEYRIGRRAAQTVSNRAALIDTLDDLKNTSVDYYATIRSTYRQNRLKEINNGKIEVEELPDISDLD